ncbi:MAG: 50S ribosomal protein L11 methyltransferase [Sphingomonadales bacterium]|nr:MAG: 50S ribosomal protein L11 methyltransferase [Sphingomonadales bacterium]
MTDLWVLRLPLNHAESQWLQSEPDGVFDPENMPTIAVFEAEDQPTGAWIADDWVAELYFSSEPDPDLVRRLAQGVAGLDPATVRAHPLAPQDWISLSQHGLPTIATPRFRVCTPERISEIRPGGIPLVIPAAEAFGTGHHPTTLGCLEALGQLARQRRFDRIADVGTGTALLALAAAKLWPRASIIASDIDPLAIAVARRTAALNNVQQGRRRGNVELITCPGVAHARFRRAPRFDLLVANILAGPLVALAPTLTARLNPGGYLLLAGLLAPQAQAVLGAYRARGLNLVHELGDREWPTLLLRKGRGVAAAASAYGARP